LNEDVPLTTGDHTRPRDAAPVGVAAPADVTAGPGARLDDEELSAVDGGWFAPQQVPLDGFDGLH